MANRTQIVCLHEGLQGRSIDPVFFNALIRVLNPGWIRQHKGSNLARFVPCGGRTELIQRMPRELLACIQSGAETTLVVCADVDHDTPDCDALREKFRREALSVGISDSDFDRVVFVFAKDRLENWIEFLLTGATDESREGPRVPHNRKVADAAKVLAGRCLNQSSGPKLPDSLQWSCRNWRRLVETMHDNA